MYGAYTYQFPHNSYTVLRNHTYCYLSYKYTCYSSSLVRIKGRTCTNMHQVPCVIISSLLVAIAEHWTCALDGAYLLEQCRSGKELKTHLLKTPFQQKNERDLLIFQSHGSNYFRWFFSIGCERHNATSYLWQPCNRNTFPSLSLSQLFWSHQWAICRSLLRVCCTTIMPRLPWTTTNPTPMHETLCAGHMVATHGA